MLAEETSEWWNHAFKCEVCNISVRSSRKLIDHVNFSPLHKTALDCNEKIQENPIKQQDYPHGRRLLYDGTKLFWRLNETLELCIYEDYESNSIAITAFQQLGNGTIPQLRLQLRSLYKAMNWPLGKVAKCPADDISEFILARLVATRDPWYGGIFLELQKLRDDTFDLALLPSSQQTDAKSANNFGVPSDVSVRRRHTIGEVKYCQNEVTAATCELKKARIDAEKLSNLVHDSIESLDNKI